MASREINYLAAPTVTLGGKAWHIRYDMNAIAELEGALGHNIREIGLRLMRGQMGTREVRALVWAGILHEFEDAAIRQVGDWLQEAGVLKDAVVRDALLNKVLTALNDAFPEPDAAKGKKGATGDGDDDPKD